MKAIDQLKVLDNEVKLKILALLADTGAKSITDISKLLNLNFSTAHKYLEQLEQAKFVKSRQETENRLKRMFYIQDFCLHIDPRNISQILQGKKIEHGEEAYGDFNIITNDGMLERFNKYRFAEPYVDAGIPKNTIEIVFDTIKNQIYDGISFIELEQMFIDTLRERVNSVDYAVSRIKDNRMNNKIIANVLSKSHPEIIESHIAKQLFVRNLGTPKLLNFVHNIRNIAIHGIEGKAPSNLKELLSQLLEMTKRTRDISQDKQAFAYFNYFIAPLAKSMSDRDISRILSEFIEQLNPSIIFYINIIDTLPKAVDKFSPTFFREDDKIYSYYASTAKRIKNIFSKLKLPKNIIINTYDFPKDTVYYSELNNTKFLSNWNGFTSTMSMGEAQDIVLNVANLPSDEEALASLLDIVIDCHKKTAELILSSFYYQISDLKSAMRDKWKYVNLSELMYSISLVNEKSNPTITKFIIEYINKKHSNIRVGIKLNSEDYIYDYLSKAKNLKQN